MPWCHGKLPRARMTSRAPAWRLGPRGREGCRLLILLVAGLVVFMAIATGSAEACPRSEGRTDLTSASAPVTQAHRFVSPASPVLKSAAGPIRQIQLRGCCGDTHSECAGHASGCCASCFTAIHDPLVGYDLERGAGDCFVGNHEMCVSRHPPPNFRPPRNLI